MDTHVKLLLLEDSPNDAALIQKLLQRSGIRFSAKVASDEEEFLAALELAALSRTSNGAALRPACGTKRYP